jgi:hypothetical protein
MNQPKLFDQMTDSVALEDVLLYALGDFQSRGKVLADRELALDRLHGAFLRAFERFGIAELSDEQIVKGLQNLGAYVVEVPNFVAKRPYRVTVNAETSSRGFELFKEVKTRD